MGIASNFLQNGSTYAAGIGGTSADLQSERDAIIGIKKQSKLHYDYSINGMPNIPNQPTPSVLDLNGVNPLGPLKDTTTPSINNSFSCGVYKNCTPEGASF